MCKDSKKSKLLFLKCLDKEKTDHSRRAPAYEKYDLVLLLEGERCENFPEKRPQIPKFFKKSKNIKKTS